MHVEPNYWEKDHQSLQDRLSGTEKELQRAIESQSELRGRDLFYGVFLRPDGTAARNH
jgi:hypothetical protein